MSSDEIRKQRHQMMKARLLTVKINATEGILPLRLLLLVANLTTSGVNSNPEKKGTPVIDHFSLVFLNLKEAKTLL